jgi:hypothetical protein
MSALFLLYVTISCLPDVRNDRTVNLTVHFIQLKLIRRHLSITLGLGVYVSDHGDSTVLLPQFCSAKRTHNHHMDRDFSLAFGCICLLCSTVLSCKLQTIPLEE